MKILNPLGLTFIALIAATSCSTLSHEATTAKVDAKIVSMTVGDMKVSKEKASATAEWKWTPFNAIKPSEIQLTATAKLLKETNSDVIVEPMVEITRRGLFRGGSVTVTGYPATYTGFHPMTGTEANAYATSRLCPTASATYVAPTAGKPGKAKPARVRKERKPFQNGSFLNVTIGVNINRYDETPTIGLKYGHYCKNHWGWYVRANLDPAKGCGVQHVDMDGEICNKSHRKFGGSAGAGALYAFSNKFGIFAGAGFGASIIGSYHRNYSSDTCTSLSTGYSVFTIPFEAGLDFRFGIVNLMAGYRYHVMPEEGTDYYSSTVFFGLGINF